MVSDNDVADGQTTVDADETDATRRRRGGDTFSVIGLFIVIPALLDPFWQGMLGVGGAFLALIALLCRPRWPWLAISVIILAVVAFIPGFLHAQRQQDLRRQAMCHSNLLALHQALALYGAKYHDAVPPDVQSLVGANFIDRDQFRCPVSHPDRSESLSLDACYVIFFPADLNAPNHTPCVIACDRATHEGEDRNVLMSNCSVRGYNVEEFRALLARPENAEFAEVFRREVGEP